MTKHILLITITLLVMSCSAPLKQKKQKEAPFIWENANIYFLLTDRFNNGDKSNDVNFERNAETGVLRGFMGGDFKGITAKIEDHYFTELGVTALWFSPIAEQIHGFVDEGTGNSYGYHGYWAKDWTSIDPNWGTEEEFAQLIEAAHSKGIRVIMDVVINHTGPVTDKDPVYGDDWVRTSPMCTYESYESTVSCTLVENLPDVLTESNKEVSLPSPLIEKWEKEGRLEEEMAELNAFFAQSGHPRAPRFYIMKWLTDFVRKYGVDGYRIDTAKHTEEGIWAELRALADEAFAEWKAQNPGKVLDNNPFYTVGEVYNYGISTGRLFDNEGVDVDYYANGTDALINFELKGEGDNNYDTIFSKYSALLSNDLKGKSVVNYLTSHDDGSPYDKTREKSFRTANILLLTPGASQIYYGDESNRNLIVEDAVGDATLRTFMNWEDIAENNTINGVKTQDLLLHYQNLGQFKSGNPAVGAGVHQQLSESPYVFSRVYQKADYVNKVIVALEVETDEKVIPVGDIFSEGTVLFDYYSDQEVVVKDGVVELNSEYNTVLLAL